MKKSVVIVLILITIFGSIYLFSIYNQEQFGLSGNIIKEFKFNRDSKGNPVFLTGYNNKKIMKVKKIQDYSESLVQQYITDNIFVINTQYRELHSPYPGRLSNRIECEDEFKPIEISNTPFNYYKIYSTDRFTYGACSWDLITYQSILYFVYCEDSNSFYQIQLFLPLDVEIGPYENKLKSLSCN